MPTPDRHHVTFLCTDLEGSSRLWEQHPEAMRKALIRHDELLRDSIERHDGRVFKTQGDAFFAVFTDPRKAVESALDAQLRLPAVVARTSEGELPLKVRMALHSGPAEEQNGDYAGPTINRAGRLVPVGYGGQVLLSAAVVNAVVDQLPPGTALNDMGEHRLKDLDGAERIYQLWHPDLPSDFPPLRSLDNPLLKHNLPRSLTRFIGREKQLAEVKSLLTHARLVTLTGPGGAGKTRLAVQAAAGLVEDHPDGVRFAELAALNDPGLVAGAVASAVGVREVSGRPILETLIEHLKGKRALLVLDNCEHLLQSCAQLAGTLLRDAPQLRLLATSREPLGTYGEATYRVPSLSVPDPLRPIDPEELSRFEAVRLFRDRAEHAQPGFEVTRGNGPALVSVCRRLDGIPLALELAAARVRSLTIEEIDRCLDRRFLLLTGGARTALPRQQTLRSLIDWSYDLLNDREKALLNRLSVFAGGWTLAAAEAVCPGDPVEEWEVLDLLTSLSDKSLVLAEPCGGTTRYRLLETVRQYAAERLLETAEPESWRRRHLHHFTRLGEEAEPHLGGADQKAWQERLDPEHDNLRSALEWSAENEPEAGLRLMGVAWRFWDLRGHHNEARKLLNTLLECSDPECKTAARAHALHAAGLFAFRQGDPPAARRHYEASLEIAREIGDRPAIASALNQLGNVAWIQGDYPAARVRHEESLQLRKELGDRRGVGASLNNLGNLAQRLGDLATARTCLEECLEICREFNDTTGIAIALNNLGNTLRLQGDPAAARTLHDECLRLRREMGDPVGVSSSLNNLAMALHDLGDLSAARELLLEALEVKRGLGDRVGVAQSLGNLGEIAYDQADYTAAGSHYRESLGLFAELGDPWGVAGTLEGLAAVASAQRTGPCPARLLGFTARLREEIGAEIPAHERPRYERQIEHARTAVSDEAAFRSLWENGRALTLGEAVALAGTPPVAANCGTV